MNLSDMMNGLREGAAKQTKFMGITLTRTEVEPILAEWDALRAENERLRAAIRKYLSHQVGHQEGYIMFRDALEQTASETKKAPV